MPRDPKMVDSKLRAVDETRIIMFDRSMTEEILNTTAQSVSEMSFCEVTDRYVAVNGRLDPVPERAALPQDLDVRRLNGRDSVLPCVGSGWRYAPFTVGDGGELSGCLVLSAADPPDLPQLKQLRTVAGTTGTTHARGSPRELPNESIGQLLGCNACMAPSSARRPISRPIAGRATNRGGRSGARSEASETCVNGDGDLKVAGHRQ
jgi:hypothetical protein